MPDTDFDPWIRHCIESFFWNRQQKVRLNNITSCPLTHSMGTLQGCALSPMFFSFYTNRSHPTMALSCTGTQATQTSKAPSLAMMKQYCKQANWAVNNLLLNTKHTFELQITSLKSHTSSYPPLNQSNFHAVILNKNQGNTSSAKNPSKLVELWSTQPAPEPTQTAWLCSH